MADQQSTPSHDDRRFGAIAVKMDRLDFIHRATLEFAEDDESLTTLVEAARATAWDASELMLAYYTQG